MHCVLSYAKAMPRPGLRVHLARLLRLAKSLARDPRIPRPVRWLIVVGLLPVPGPFDEIVLAVALAFPAHRVRLACSHVSSSAAAWCSLPGRRCPYRSRVTVMLVWPM